MVVRSLPAYQTGGLADVFTITSDGEQPIMEQYNIVTARCNCASRPSLAGSQLGITDRTKERGGSASRPRREPLWRGGIVRALQGGRPAPISAPRGWPTLRRVISSIHLISSDTGKCGILSPVVMPARMLTPDRRETGENRPGPRAARHASERRSSLRLPCGIRA